MSDEINVKTPDWRDIPDFCPKCDRDLERDLDGGRLTGWKVGYREATSDHGEYTEVYCHACDFPLQRYYEEEEVTPQKDRFVDPEPWVYTAEILETETTLKHREAQVKALKTRDYTHGDIADKLGISESTVGEYSIRINNRIEESIRTLEEIGEEIDPLRHIEGQFEGMVLMPNAEWTCGSCHTSLEPGDDVQVLSEFLNDYWKTVDIFCHKCEPEPSSDWFEAAKETATTYAVVEGELDRKGDEVATYPIKRVSKDSLTLHDAAVAQIIN